MALSVASGRVCYVYFENGQLADWALSKKASKSPAKAQQMVCRWIEMLEPDVVINQKITPNFQKGDHTQALIEAITSTAANYELHDISVKRKQLFANKYEEAAAYAQRFPDLKAVLPKYPQIWEGEPINISYFEAVYLALAVIDGETERPG